MMRRPVPRGLLILFLLFGTASFIHFVHNAEFLADYPNMPASWSRTDVYLAWLVMTAVGLIGLLLVARGLQIAGLLFVVAYAGLGLDSLGHYVLAPMSAHTGAMNATIIVEVTTAAVLLIEAVRLVVRRTRAVAL
jgi:hypothetical protein